MDFSFSFVLFIDIGLIFTVPQRDTKAAADALIRLLKDDVLCERYGKEARAHIEEVSQFDFKGKWCEIFESLEREHTLSVTPEQKLSQVLNWV